MKHVVSCPTVHSSPSTDRLQKSGLRDYVAISLTARFLVKPSYARTIEAYKPIKDCICKEAQLY